MSNTFGKIILTNKRGMIKIKLESGATWQTGDGRLWWRSGDVTPCPELSTVNEVKREILRLMRISAPSIELLSVLDSILSPRHISRIPLKAEYQYIITDTARGVSVARRILYIERKCLNGSNS